MNYFKNNTFLLMFFILYGCDALTCQYQVCRECNEREINGRSREVTCNLRNLVSVTWLGSSSVPMPGPPNADPEFACIKMTASNPDILGDSTDVIRGCTIYMGADYQCQLLGNLEVSRGKKNAKCDFCHGDNCNGSPLKFSYLPYIVTFIVIIYLYH